MSALKQAVIGGDCSDLGTPVGCQGPQTIGNGANLLMLPWGMPQPPLRRQASGGR